MSPMQQIFLGLGAVSEKTYVDDVFSTFLYTGTGSAQTINNGINLSESGGMVWFKSRTTGGSSYNNHSVVDTARVDSSGRGKSIYPNLTQAQFSPEGTANITTSFNNNGFTTGTNQNNATNTQTLASWTFRKAPGFFDVVTYTGNGTAGRTVSHNLGSVPGFIVIKCTSHSDHWCCYHKSRGGTKFIALDLANVESTNANGFHDTTPTSTEVTLGISGRCNGNGKTYVMYLFAGGESTAATARSVEFDGSGDYLTIPTSSNMEFATGDYTIDFWFKRNATGEMAIYDGTDGGTSNANRRQRIYVGSDGKIAYYDNTPRVCTSVLSVGTWNHVAVTRASGTSRIFINGTLEQSWDGSGNNHKKPDSNLYIGRYVGGTGQFNGSISNLRMIKGHAAYTSSFIPPTEPPTSTSDGASGTEVKFLGCNNSSVTGAHINLLNTITANGDPTASTDSPFDDPAGFVFGKGGSQNLIKCGSYTGNGSATGPEINLGFEPSWILLKNATASSRDWKIVDAMRGIVTGGDDASLRPNEYNNEDNESVIDLTSTGFKITASNAHYNENGETIIYCAIRRPDGYVGKPRTATELFAMDVGSSSSTIPTFDSGFPVDMRMLKYYAQSGNWYLGTRLMGEHSLYTNSTVAENTDTWAQWDSNAGDAISWGSNEQAWQWKRHEGFDVVTYLSDGVRGRQIPHRLSKTPEMMWIKLRDGNQEWIVYHKGLNGGTNPEQKYLRLDGNNSEATATVTRFNNEAPTSTHFTVGEDNAVNSETPLNYVAMLFASVNGISKVGYYDGSNSDVTITTGFQPRFIFIKSTTDNFDWCTFDSRRGMTASGDDPMLKLNANAAQDSGNNWITGLNSTSFTVGRPGGSNIINVSAGKYIYYAHA